MIHSSPKLWTLNHSISDYVGCFDVPTDAAILVDYEDMTIPVCVELCRGQGQTYALLDVTSCWCSSTISMASAKSPTSCTSMCLTNKAQMCGGPAHVSAYSVGETVHCCQRTSPYGYTRTLINNREIASVDYRLFSTFYNNIMWA